MSKCYICNHVTNELKMIRGEWVCKDFYACNDRIYEKYAR